MRIHILGICGTFMGGVAIIARQLGHTVTGSDQNVYPPMSDALRAAGIQIVEGYDPAQLHPRPDCVIIGNSMSRGNPVIEAVLAQGIPYNSGPQWLAENVLHQRHVLAVSGTHGKTTTTSVLTWILHQAGLNAGYLIGGVPLGFATTAALGEAPYFVIEADEYDSAFFDKQSKFIHYRPRTLIFNNLEYDHADIFPNLEAIKKQFQILLRTVPSNGLVIYPTHEVAVNEVLTRGCWARKESISLTQGDWTAQHVSADGSQFELWHQGQQCGVVNWRMLGQHNVLNALAASAAAFDVGVTPAQIIAALQSFQGIKRRLEIRGEVNGVTVYDDFAHHPTAIATTLQGLRARVGSQRIVAVLQFGSNTMKQGTHDKSAIAAALQHADSVVMLQPEGQQWDASQLVGDLSIPAKVYSSVEAIINALTPQLKPTDHVLIMSNKGFDGIHQRLLDRMGH